MSESPGLAHRVRAPEPLSDRRLTGIVRYVEAVSGRRRHVTSPRTGRNRPRPTCTRPFPVPVSSPQNPVGFTPRVWEAPLSSWRSGTRTSTRLETRRWRVSRGVIPSSGTSLRSPSGLPLSSGELRLGKPSGTRRLCAEAAGGEIHAGPPRRRARSLLHAEATRHSDPRRRELRLDRSPGPLSLCQSTWCPGSRGIPAGHLRQRHGSESQVSPPPDPSSAGPALVTKPHRQAAQVRDREPEVANRSAANVGCVSVPMVSRGSGYASRASRSANDRQRTVMFASDGPGVIPATHRLRAPAQMV